MPSRKLSLISTKLLEILLLSTALAALSSCAVAIKEEDFYTDKGPDGAVITHFFSPDIRDISKSAWDDIREGMTCMSPQAISDIKGEIEQLCTKSHCSQQTEEAATQALTALSRIQTERWLQQVRRRARDIGSVSASGAGN